LNNKMEVKIIYTNVEMTCVGRYHPGLPAQYPVFAETDPEFEVQEIKYIPREWSDFVIELHGEEIGKMCVEKILNEHAEY